MTLVEVETSLLRLLVSMVVVALKTCMLSGAALSVSLVSIPCSMGEPEALAMPSMRLLSLAPLLAAFGLIPPLDVVGSVPAAAGLDDWADAGVVVFGTAALCLAGRLWLLELAVGAGRRAC